MALVQEDAIDPDLPICDPHHHLWDYREGRIERRYLLDEIQCDLQSGHNIVVLWNSFKRITENYSASEKTKLYHDTAARVYRLT